MLRTVKYGLYGAIVSGLVAGPVAAWHWTDNSVRLTVDGQTRTVSTGADDVGDLLADEDLTAGRHDLLAPTAGTAVKDGMSIVLRRGRLLHLQVDGKQVQVWTTAPTVQQALAQLGYTTSDFVSVSRARRLPLSPTAISIRTPRTITVVHDGQRERVSTTEATVGAALHQIGVDADADDRLSPSAGSATNDGLVVTLQRVGERTMTRTETVRYETTRRRSSDVYRGTTKVLRPGRAGRAQVTYSIVYVDGKPTTRTRVSSTVVVPSRGRVVLIGTKAPTGPQGAQAIARSLLPRFGFADSEFSCLVQMWNNESGWRTNAENSGSGAYGIPQALPGSKMSTAGPNWQTDARTQILWGLGYIKSRYGTPCGAWGFWQANNYY